MKLTKTKLKQIIKEEITKLLAESNIVNRIKIRGGNSAAVRDMVVNFEDPETRIGVVTSISPEGVVVYYDESPIGDETFDPTEARELLMTLVDAESTFGPSALER